MTSLHAGYSQQDSRGAPPPTTAGFGGMPRSRLQQQMEDMLESSGTLMGAPELRPASRAGFSRRASASSNSSGKGGMFGWVRQKKNMSASYDDEDEQDGGHFDDSLIGANSDVMLGEISGLRDRDRYPSISKESQNPQMGPGAGRTMSITSSMSAGGFDTTPIIPTLRANAANSQYRKNLNNSRKSAFKPDFPPRNIPTSPTQNQNYMPSPHLRPRSSMSSNGGPPPPRGYIKPPPMGRSQYGPPGRLGSMTGPPPEFVNGGRAMSMSMENNYGLSSMMKPPQKLSRPPSRFSHQQQYSSNQQFQPGPQYPPNGMPNGMVNATPHNGFTPTGMPNGMPSNGMMMQSMPPMPQYKRVSASTMTDPMMFGSSGTGHNSFSTSTSTVELGIQTDDTSFSSIASPPKGLDSKPRSVDERYDDDDKTSNDENIQRILDLGTMNKSLMDEIRLVTGELADSIRRELGVAGEHENDADDEESEERSIVRRTQKFARAESQLDLERRKRLLAESKLSNLQGNAAMASLSEGYDLIELERDLAERTRMYQNEQRENEVLRDTIKRLTEEFAELQVETDQLKTGILPQLRSHVEDLEIVTAAGDPIELLKQIEELKVENKRITALMEENSIRGPVGEKLKAVEEQRDALREALRSLRERKGHELRQSAERVRQLESKLEKEKVVNNQMHRKLVQTRSLVSQSSPSTGLFPASIFPTNHSPHSSSSAETSSSAGESSNREPTRSASTGLQPPSASFAHDERTRSASPVSFEISQEPTWLNADGRYQRKRVLSATTKSGTEQLPSSLGSN